jgi:hypothetical protein
MPSAATTAVIASLRKHAWRPLAFTAGFVAILSVLYGAGYSHYESPQARADRKALKRMARGGTAVAFGSSHGFSILLEEAGLDGVNLSHGGQDALEMAHLARIVKRAAPRLRTVLFTISYFSFSLDNATDEERSGRRLEMYATFPSLDFIPGDGSTWLKGVLAPIVTRDHWQSMLVPGAPARDIYPPGIDSERNRRRDSVVSSERVLAAHAKKRCESYIRLMRDSESRHPRLHQDAFAALRDVSLELETAGVRTVLVTPPYFPTYDACFDPKRKERARRLAKRIADETGAEYFDASTEAELTARELFSNSDHVNLAGKTAFSRWLKRRLGGATGPG